MHDPTTHAEAPSRVNPHRRQKNKPTRRVTGRYNTTSCRPPSGQNSTAYPRRPSKPTGNRYRNTRRSNPRTGLVNATIDVILQKGDSFQGTRWLAGTGHFSQERERQRSKQSNQVRDGERVPDRRQAPAFPKKEHPARTNVAALATRGSFRATFPVPLMPAQIAEHGSTQPARDHDRSSRAKLTCVRVSERCCARADHSPGSITPR